MGGISTTIEAAPSYRSIRSQVIIAPCHHGSATTPDSGHRGAEQPWRGALSIGVPLRRQLLQPPTSLPGDCPDAALGGQRRTVAHSHRATMRLSRQRRTRLFRRDAKAATSTWVTASLTRPRPVPRLRGSTKCSPSRPSRRPTGVSPAAASRPRAEHSTQRIRPW